MATTARNYMKSQVYNPADLLIVCWGHTYMKNMDKRSSGASTTNHMESELEDWKH